MTGFDNSPQTPAPDTGVVQIRNRRTGKVKEYQTVALRIKKFREDHPDWPVVTEIINRDDECVVMVARIYMFKGDERFLIATGHSEEFRVGSDVNRTSALENSETSAIGRALACLGYGGSDFASADEVQRAMAASEALDEVSETALPQLKKAAQFGSNKLQKAWESLTKEQRMACRNQLAGLKRVAESADNQAIEQARQDGELPADV